MATHEETTGGPRGWAPQRPALEWADRLTRQVVEGTGALAGGLPPSLGRTLREAAVLVHAGTAAACRCADPGRARHALSAVDRALGRLRLWIELSGRFGDLPPRTSGDLLQAVERLHHALAALAAAASATRPSRPPASPALGDLSLSLPAAAKGGRRAVRS